MNLLQAYEALNVIAEDSLKRITEDFDRVRAAAQCSRNCHDFYNAFANKVSEKEMRPYAKAAAKFVKDNYGLTGAEAEELLWSGYVVWKRLHEGCKKGRKSNSKGIDIKQLVEEMEENEDTVECTWCEELFDKSECRKEVNLGWLCSRCEAAIKSRGETLTFKENNYWDFLDESAAIPDGTIIGKYVQLVSSAQYKGTDAPYSLVELKSLLRTSKNYRFSKAQIDFIAKFDNRCKVLQETEKGCLVVIPCYYRDRQDRSKFEEQPRYLRCWVPKAHTKLISTDLSEG